MKKILLQLVKIFSAFPCSFDPTSCFYREPDESSRLHPMLFLSDPVIFSSLRLRLQSGLFYFRFPYQNPVYISLFPFASHMLLPAYPYIMTVVMFREKCRSWSSSSCTFLLVNCYFLPLMPKCFLWLHVREISARAFPLEKETKSQTQAVLFIVLFRIDTGYSIECVE